MRKIFAVIQNITQIVPSASSTDSPSCQIGGSDTMTRMNIVIGVNTGMSESTVASVDSGESEGTTPALCH